LLATGGKDATVRLWKLDGSAYREPLSGHIDGVVSLAFATDGQSVVSGSRNDRIRVWNTGGTRLHELGGLRDIVTDIAFSPRGDVFAASDAPGEIMIWNVDGSVHTNVFKAHDGYLHALAFSPDGTRLASAGADAVIKMWDLNGRPQATPLTGHVGAVQA